MRHLALVSLLGGLTTSCDGGSEEPPAVCALEAAPSSTPVGGDANGDGKVDVSDGTNLARSFLAGGPAAVCPEGVDLVPDGATNLGDIPALWYSVGSKTAPYRPEVGECAQVERTVEPPCGDGVALGVSIAGATAEVVVTSPSLPVEAWSFTLRAEGCTFEAGTTAGTTAADKADGTGGLRNGGVVWQSVTPAEAQVLTVLDWRNQGVLPSGTSAVHSFSVAPAGTSCGACTLTLIAGDPVTGVESVVAAEGWRYVPALGSATVELCP
jgi:hypothetical protein